MKLLIGLALAAALVLAGCSSSPTPSPTTSGPAPTGTTNAPTTGPTSSAPPTSGPTSAPPTSTGAPGENRAPKADLVASYSSGVPVNVSFAASGSDPDGDELTATLDFGDGTPPQTLKTFPNTVLHRYTAPGNITTILTVTDGKATTRTYANLTLKAQVGKPTKEFTGTLEPGDCVPLASGGGTVAMDGKFDGWSYELTPDAVDVQLWQGEGDTDPFVNQGNSGKIPAGTTSAHICTDSPDRSLISSVPTTESIAWTFTLSK